LDPIFLSYTQFKKFTILDPKGARIKFTFNRAITVPHFQIRHGICMSSSITIREGLIVSTFLNCARRMINMLSVCTAKDRASVFFESLIFIVY